MADKTPETMTVKLRAEYSTGKDDPKKPGEKIRLPYKDAVKLMASGMAVHPDTPDAAIVGSDEARTVELVNEVTLLRGEVDKLGEAAKADAKTIIELRAELTKAEGEIKKFKG